MDLAVRRPQPVAVHDDQGVAGPGRVVGRPRTCRPPRSCRGSAASVGQPPRRTGRRAARRTAPRSEPGSPKSRANASGSTTRSVSGSSGRRRGRRGRRGSRPGSRRRRPAAPGQDGGTRRVSAMPRPASRGARLRAMSPGGPPALGARRARRRAPPPGWAAPTRPRSRSTGSTLLEHALGAPGRRAEVVVVGDEVPTSAAGDLTVEDPPRGGPAAGLLAGLDRLPAAAPAWWWCSPWTCRGSPPARSRRLPAPSRASARRRGARRRGRAAPVPVRRSTAATRSGGRRAGVRASEHGLPMRGCSAACAWPRCRPSGEEARDVDTWEDLRDLRERLDGLSRTPTFADCVLRTEPSVRSCDA